MKFSGLGKGLESLIPRTIPVKPETAILGDAPKTKESIFLIEVDKIKENMRDEMSRRISESVQDMITRAKEMVEHMVERLEDPKTIFRNSVVTNLGDLVELLPKLNFTNDKKVSAMIVDLKALCVNPEHLRSNSKTRAAVLKRAKAILRGIK